jgi:hypothetical protein
MADGLPLALLQAMACAVGGREAGTYNDRTHHITNMEN